MTDKAMKQLINYAMIGQSFIKSQEKPNRKCPECGKEGLLPLNERHSAWGCFLCGYNSEKPEQKV